MKVTGFASKALGKFKKRRPQKKKQEGDWKMQGTRKRITRKP